MGQQRNQRGNKRNTRIQMKMKTQSLGHGDSISKREIQSDRGRPQETRKISNKQSNLMPKGTRKRTNKPKVKRRKEIIRSGAKSRLKNKKQ